jgi:NAD(P)-dependent dehydrogenase (short-subunit alcohol dehydrogenase family)
LPSARAAERPERAAAKLRASEPEEIGSLAAYLVTKRCSYMTGTTVESCGGATKYI